MDILQDFLPIDVFAKELGKHPRTISRWTNEPDGLPFTKLGRVRLIHLPTARKWLADRMVHPNPTRGGFNGS